MNAGTPRPGRTLIATILRGGGATGVETHSRQVMGFLTESGAEVELVTPFTSHFWFASLLFAPRRLLVRVAPAISVVYYRTLHSWFLRRELKRRLRDGRAATVYAQCPVSADAALRARRGPSQAVVLVVHFHVSQAEEWAFRGLIPRHGRAYRRIQALEKRVLSQVDAVVYVARSSLQDLGGARPGSRARWTVLPNFTTDGPTEREAHLGPAADLVTIGSLERQKNHEFLLEILAECARRGRRYTLDVIGQGSLHHHLVARAEELGVCKQVRFLGRLADARAELPGHRAYVHSAEREVLPLAVIEAMAARLPILTTEVGGIPELLDGGRVGLFWPLDDASKAATELIDLLEDDARLAQLGTAARARFLDTYNADNVGPYLIRFLSCIETEEDSRPESTRRHAASRCE